jgi:hypothetical protein
MFLPAIPFHRLQLQRVRAITRRLTLGGAAVAFLLLAACSDSSGPGGGGGGGETAALSGTVRAAAGSAALENAQITIGEAQATTDADGHFEMTGLPVGAVTIQAQRPGYLAATATVTLGAGANTHDFALDVQEIFLSGPHAMYLPAGVGPMRAVIIALGGPITSGFVTGGQIGPPDKPAVEQSLQELGQSLRALARTSRVALLGTTTIAMGNTGGSDNVLFVALSSLADLSAHPELAAAPVLLVGLSAGAPESAGLAGRNPGRAIGLIERVPVSIMELTTPEALAVPTFVMQAALDHTANNPLVQATFLTNRSRGGLWALGVEPGIDHHVVTAVGNGVMVEWIRMVLTLRLGPALGDPLVALDQASGWLGNQATLEIAPWASYPDDPGTASWLLSELAATSWKALATTPRDESVPPRRAAPPSPVAHFQSHR